MATLKIVVLPHQKKQDGTWNVKIRVTHHRQSAFIATDYYVTQKQINKKSFEISDNFLRMTLEEYVFALRKTIVKLGLKTELYTAKELAEYLEKENKAGSDADIDFAAFCNNRASETIAKGKEGTGKLYKSTINSLVDYVGREKISIVEITSKFLEKYEAWLIEKELTVSGINLYMRTIRALFNAAREAYNDEDKGVLRIAHYPFAKFKITPVGETKKRALKPDVIKALRDLPDVKTYGSNDHSRENIARDVFMLSFYLIGMNTVDLYNCEKIENGRIIYQRTKTKTRRADNAEISIKIEPEALPLIEKYRDKTGHRLFSFYKLYADRSTFNSNVNKGLKEVGKKEGVEVEGLNTYYARHSWASIARNICRVSKDDVAMALNHSDQVNKVTDIYIDKDWSIIDEANRKVLDCLL